MLYFENDYCEGAHPAILQKLTETNFEKVSGYGTDPYCASAREKIRAACACPEADVQFISGGTQSNAIVIASMLQRWQGVVAAATGHVAGHEAGAIEYTGHKVITLPQHNGKLDSAELRALVATFYADDNHDHMVFPGMVYISHPTEYGTLYTKAELEALHAVCQEYKMPLFLDGARLGYGLAAEGTDVTLADLARLTEEYRRPMNVGMCFPRLTYADYAKDLALLQTMKRDTADLTHFYLAPGIEVNFMNRSDAQLEEQFRYIFRLGRDADLPLIFNFNSWWDCTPCGRDGEGGYLNDIPYQQITYNPLTGKKTLSVPNIWRNTPWLTMNHPRLNALRAQRLRQTMACFAKVRARFFARYGAEPQVKIFIDNEPTYWSQFAYCTSPDSGGDFNERCIADAARDSVDLEPKGPALTLPQREWLLKNGR